MPPPRTLRCRTASRINSAGPASAEPTGAPSPLLKQTPTVSKCSAQRGGETAGDDRVPEPCAVEVRPQAVLPGPAAKGRDRFVRLHAAAAAVVRVFQAEQARSREVHVVGQELRLHLLQGEHAVLPRKRPGRNTAEFA